MISNMRLGQKDASPEAEDRALFKTYGGPIEVEMVPHVSRPGKHLFLCRAFFESTREIVVVISGRRTEEVKPLENFLKQMESASHQQAVARCAPAPTTDQVRVPVQIKGSWDVRVHSDPDEEDIKIVQLIVARWAFTDPGGKLHQFGESPAFDQTTQRRGKSYILQSREIDAVPRAPRFGAPED